MVGRVGGPRLQRHGLPRRRAHAGRQAVTVSVGRLLAARLDIPVVPMRIDGLWEMKLSGRKIARARAS